jgi:hypothetical protein
MLGLIALSIADGVELSRQVNASDVLATIKTGQPAEFDNYIILGDLDLSALKIGNKVHFNNTRFQGSANFESTDFNSDAYFGGSAFNSDVNFEGSAFNGITDFRGAAFNGDAYFGYSDFNGTADFEYTNFNGNASFVYTNFNRYANFWNSDFNRTANFGGSDFTGIADFRMGFFKVDAKFEHSNFKGATKFWNSDFNGTADFEYARFKNDADFRESDFKGIAYFRNSDFNGTANFAGSDFNGTARFWDTGFYDNADFRDSRFNITDFSAAKFNKEAQFNDAQFAGIANFDNSRFTGDALFENTIFQNTLSLTRARYDKLYIRWYNIKCGLVYDDAAYMSLMKNFKNLGYFEDYDSCYFQYRKEHRNQPWPAVNGWEAGIRKIIDYPLEWFYGYGTKPLNAFLFSLGIIISFGGFWGALGLGGPKDRTKESLKEGEEWLDGDITDILGFSVTVFLSGTKFFIDPPAIPKIEGHSRSLIKKAFVLERLLGALFSILFFIAVSGTIVRAS